MNVKSKLRMILVLFSVILIILAGCDGTTEINSGSGSASSDAEEMDYSILPEIEMTDKKIIILGQEEGKADVFEEHYGGEVERIVVSDSEVFNRFMIMVMSDERIDVFENYMKPVLVTQGYLKSLDDYIDFSIPLWQDVKEINDLMQDKEGKHYTAVTSVQRTMSLWYNKEIFEENGEPTPDTYLADGTWDWNKMREIALNLTIDVDSDGTNEVTGLCIDEVDGLLYSCGKHMVSFNGDGTATNNILSPEVARAVNFFVKLDTVDKVLYQQGDGRTAFQQGKVAMITGGVWYRMLWPDMLGNDTAMFVPFPKDPDADKYYIQQGTAGYMIPSTAGNVAAACAFISSKRFEADSLKYSSAYQEYLDFMKEEYNWEQKHEDMFRNELNGPDKVGVPISYISFGVTDFYGDVFARPSRGEPWATIANEIAPKIDEKIALAYGD